ncbi:hypothetical protein BC835DRAFT_1276792 [Cytidiella melzeri]|nr:hypothetical protein BC835DRAFT_1276792 [Cytidiella melzeri]
MATTLSQLSACVTRILALTGFPKELKTRDIQAAFSEWENASGGFKIKWLDDTSLLIVFADATVAKRAYLHTLAYPPPIFSTPTSPATAVIKPYDGPDAQAVILNVNSRQHNSNGRGHNVRNSVAHGRGASVSQSARNINTTNGAADVNNTSPREREQPSPTLPSLPSHPTLNALISSSLAEGEDPSALDPAGLSAQPEHSGPRIGDPGKRMLGAALGVRHPALGPRVIGNGVGEMQRAMGGLIVAE